MLYNDKLADVEQLLIKMYLDGLDPMEETRLEDLLNKHTGAADLYEYYKTIGRYELPPKDMILSQQLAYEKMLQEVKQTKVPVIGRKHVWPYTLTMAAAILGLVLIIIKPKVRPTPADSQKIATLANDTVAKISLRLANGTQIVLKQSGKQPILAGESQLLADNTEKTLELVAVADNDSRWNTLEVPRKLDYKINLSDGSTVHLNAATRLKFPFSFSGSKREVHVEGEAYFIIAKKANQPFIVHTNDIDIEVLGTTFNVNTYSEDVVYTALVDGSIKVKGGKRDVLLRPGHYLSAHKGDYKIIPLDEDAILSWRRGVYYFYNTPLEEICSTLVRWFDVKVIIDDPAMRSLSFSGKLDKNQPIGNFLAAMQATSMFNYRFEGEMLHISR
jgi:transmembrane sensor